MIDIKTVNNLTGKILEAEGGVEQIAYKINQIKEGKEIEAELSLEINKNRRSRTRYWLNKDEVILILQRLLESSKEDLAKLKKQYDSMQ